MLRLIVDSCSSIKEDEKEKYNVDILPVKVVFEDKEYLDGIDISIDEFYKKMIDENLFPKTSLPSLENASKLVRGYLDQGDQVLIITLSSEISGEYNALRLLFEDEKDVYIFDSRLAVGGIRLLVEEVNRNRNLPVEEIIKKLNLLIPKIKIYAIPENLNYLYKGGRLSKATKIIGNVLNIKPIIGFIDGKVKVITLKHGIKSGINFIAESLKNKIANLKYPIIASYTYNKKNLDVLMEATDKKYLPAMTVVDNLDPAVACHWGPNAFGYIFVGE